MQENPPKENEKEPVVMGQITRNEVTLPALMKTKRAKKGEEGTQYVGMPDITDEASLIEGLKFYGWDKALRRVNGMLNQTWENLYDRICTKETGKNEKGEVQTEPCEFEFDKYKEAVADLHDRTWEGETIKELNEKLIGIQEEYTEFLTKFDPTVLDPADLGSYRTKAAEYISEIKEIRVAIQDRSRKKDK